MKTPEIRSSIAPRRRARLLAALLICLPATSLAADWRSETPKKFPQRLPAIGSQSGEKPSPQKLPLVDPTPASTSKPSDTTEQTTEEKQAAATPHTELPTKLPAPARTTATDHSPDTPAVVNRTADRLTSDFAATDSRVPMLPTSAIRRDETDSVALKGQPVSWLRTMSSTAANEISRRLIEKGSQEYGVGAWASAEATAWESLRWAAQAVDMAERESGSQAFGETASARLKTVRTTIREARDFSGAYGQLDGAAILRMARSHQTDLLDDQDTSWMSATDASDRYLDDARVHLASIAARSPEAARTMDLLAAVYLKRADAKTLPSATALCLRRAALQGQPENANLAYRLGAHLSELGLLSEARWALEHSLSLEPNQQTAATLAAVLRRSGHQVPAFPLQDDLHHPNKTDSDGRLAASRPRVPQVTQLSPADFAALSQPVMPVSRESVSAIPVSARLNVTSAPVSTTNPAASAPSHTPEQTAEQPGRIKRIMNSFKRLW